MASIEEQLNKILEEFVEDERETIRKDMKRAAQDTVKDLKATSPKGPNGYANGWTVKTMKEALNTVSFTVHNAKFPGLTHLLENSHVIKNQFGTYGRSVPQKHIAPAEAKAVADLVNKLEKDL